MSNARGHPRRVLTVALSKHAASSARPFARFSLGLAFVGMCITKRAHDEKYNNEIKLCQDWVTEEPKKHTLCAVSVWCLFASKLKNVFWISKLNREKWMDSVWIVFDGVPTHGLFNSSIFLLRFLFTVPSDICIYIKDKLCSQHTHIYTSSKA